MYHLLLKSHGNSSKYLETENTKKNLLNKALRTNISIQVTYMTLPHFLAAQSFILQSAGASLSSLKADMLQLGEQIRCQKIPVKLEISSSVNNY